MNMIRKLCYLTFIACITSFLPNTVFATNHPTIMVTIKPFYNICAKIMQSVGTPELLLQNNASPHDYHLKPSDIKLIDSAQLIIWGGPELEAYLIKPLENVSTTKILNLSTIKGLRLLPLRTATNWEQHSHDHTDGHSHDHHHADHNMFDAHYWLDPDNAILIANAIARHLIDIDPDNSKLYSENLQDFIKQLKTKKIVWKKQLKQSQGVPYIVFHDAYQYYDRFFALEGIGAISLNPEIPPSVQRIQQIKNLLANNKVACIFSEPQFNDKIILTLTEGMSIYIGMLDPLGQQQDIGPNGYILMMDKLTNQFAACGASNVQNL